MNAILPAHPTDTPHTAGRPLPTRRLRLCLAASGGGHVRQLLDLESIWAGHDYFFVTEDTSLGESLAEKHPVHFVPHVAMGQARLSGPLRMLSAAVRNFGRSAKIILRERPDVLISTGAGAVFFSLLWARLLGARIIVIESFARFDSPSLFARIAAPFAHYLAVQSPALSRFFPNAEVFDPLRILDGSPPPKKPLLFATVGATLPFERLVDSIEEVARRGAFDGRFIIQTGVGARRPGGLESHETLPFDTVQGILRDAQIVVCHGGTGSLITALRQGCHVIAMPRLMERGEHYDNHQAEITDAFAARGLITVARDADELEKAIVAATTRKPVLATTDPARLTAKLGELLATEAAKSSRRV